ncbi:hypothetical protein [Brevibacillus laterosporus]|uniref:hypothetical protein n=1 Tax=Brevibacillus laterosporus TaxID=1465 RepID=UPI000839BF85|nr:hypothetical protein [Brevibacillus laterosporus]
MTTLQEERLPKVRRYLRYISLFILGGVVGGAIFLFLFIQRMEDLMLENKNLYVLNDRLQNEMDNLNELHKVARKKQNVVIEDVEITFLGQRPNTFVEEELKHSLEKDLAQLKRKKVEQVGEMHEILHELLQKKEYIIQGKVIEVNIKTLVISRVLHLYVVAKEQPKTIG